MQEMELIHLWKAYDKKLDESLQLNRQNATEITTMKVQTLLHSMKPAKLFAVIIGICWVAGLGLLLVKMFLNDYETTSLFFLYSLSLQVLITAVAIVVYIYQLSLLHNINLDEPVVLTQQKLAKIKASTLWVTRILFLQVPLWTTFYLSGRFFDNIPAGWLIFQCTITLLFTVLALWLFFNIRAENANKKWFRLLFSGNEWQPLMKAADLLTQVKDYEI